MRARNLLRISTMAATIILVPLVLQGAEVKLSGYLTFGENVVVTPDHLQLGDVVVIADQNNVVVFERRISQQTNFEPLDLPSGLYRLIIERDDQVITEKTIPYKM